MSTSYPGSYFRYLWQWIPQHKYCKLCGKIKIQFNKCVFSPSKIHQVESMGHQYTNVHIMNIFVTRFTTKKFMLHQGLTK